MSQLRAMRRGFRAAFAVAAVCALMFSLLTSGAARQAHAFAGGVACDHSANFATAPATAALKEPSTQRDGAPAHGGHRCPDCCLSAHAAPAVLPERVASAARPAVERWSKIQHSAAATQPPESFASNGANGARAPPSIHIS